MPLIIAVHKWKPEDEITMMKELVAGFSAPQPEGVKLCFTYALPQGAYCVWDVTSRDALEKVFDQYLPTLKKFTTFVPVVQMYPPTIEYELLLAQQIINAASK